MESDMVEYRIGNSIVRVTKDDAEALRDDAILFGQVHINIDHHTDIGTRVDPRSILIRQPE